MPGLLEFMKMFMVALGIITGAVVLWKFVMAIKWLFGRIGSLADSVVGKIAMFFAAIAGIVGLFSVLVAVFWFGFSRMMTKPDPAKAQKEGSSPVRLASLRNEAPLPPVKENPPRAEKRARDPVFEVRTNEPAKVTFYKAFDDTRAGSIERHMDDHRTVLVIPVYDEAYAIIAPIRDGIECSYETKLAPGKRFPCELKTVEIAGKKLMVGYATYDMK